MWWIKKINSKEYLQLKKEIDLLRISVETLDIEVKLYKQKLRSKAKIDYDDKEKDFNNSVLLPET